MSGPTLIGRATNAFVRVVEAGAADAAVWVILTICAFGSLYDGRESEKVMWLAAMMVFGYLLLRLIDSIFRYLQKQSTVRTHREKSSNLTKRHELEKEKSPIKIRKGISEISGKNK